MQARCTLHLPAFVYGFEQLVSVNSGCVCFAFERMMGCPPGSSVVWWSGKSPTNTHQRRTCPKQVGGLLVWGLFRSLNTLLLGVIIILCGGCQKENQLVYLGLLFRTLQWKYSSMLEGVQLLTLGSHVPFSRTPEEVV